MGKRKTRKIVQTKKTPKLDTVFDCPFCNHSKTVEVKISKGVGELSCRVCCADFQTVVSNLSEPVDIYSEWIDECERFNS